jgi:hypothetical protein
MKSLSKVDWKLNRIGRFLFPPPYGDLVNMIHAYARTVCDLISLVDGSGSGGDEQG